MNKLIDLVNQWVNRLTVRILVISGVSEASVNKVSTALRDRQQLITEQDKKIRGRFYWVKYLLISAVIAIVLYIVLNYKQLIKKIVKR
jgi:hypothetical protein